MRFATFSIAVVLGMMPTMNGQLYLITGTPKQNARYASDLVEIGDSGVKSTTEILSQEVGFAWAAISYEAGTAVLLSGLLDNRAIVIDLKQATVVKQCTVPGLSPYNPLEFDLVDHWLAALPGGELTVGLSFLRRTGRALQVEGMSLSLSPGASCDRSFSTVPPNDSIRYIVAQGMVGVGDNHSPEGTDVTIAPNGELVYGNTGVGFGLRIPTEFLKVLPKETFARIDTNTAQMAIVAVAEEATRAGTRYLLFRKSDQSWHEIPIKSDDFGLRGFGRFVAGVEDVAKSPEQPVTTEAERINRRTAGNSGRSEWRDHATRTGPDIVESFEYARTIYPGRLHVYNIDTEKLFTITTNQGDSEILLIEDNTVYYRVSDRLYKAPITDSGIGAATLIATDEAIRDAHWAFIKH